MSSQTQPHDQPVTLGLTGAGGFGRQHPDAAGNRSPSAGSMNERVRSICTLGRNRDNYDTSGFGESRPRTDRYARCTHRMAQLIHTPAWARSRTPSETR